MSDKNKPEQKQPERDKPSDEKSVPKNNNPIVDSSPSDSEKQQGLSASIKLTSQNPQPDDKKTVSAAKKDTNNTKTTSHSSSVKKASDMSQKTIDKKVTTTPKAQETSVSKQQKRTSKTAIFPLIIALLAVTASAGHYYWAEQQKPLVAKQLSEQLQAQLEENKKAFSQQLLVQTQQYNKALNNVKADIARDTTKNITYLQQQIANLTQNQPSDWLLHEAEYLIRVASRGLWLEKNTTAAIGLLRDADRRIEELDDPQFLPIRQIIQHDIATLQLLPKLNTDNVILKLMALAEQTKQLSFPRPTKPDSENDNSDLELTNNIEDWDENIIKTLKRFSGMFLTINRENVNTSPLTSPEFKQNLRENLNLKLQTAIWAASKGKTKIYQQTLTDIQTWLNDYFDMTNVANQHFSQALLALTNETINVDYPNKLDSLAAIREALANSNAPIPAKPPVNTEAPEPKALYESTPANTPQEAGTKTIQQEET